MILCGKGKIEDDIRFRLKLNKLIKDLKNP
jgi:hypothetical protein